MITRFAKGVFTNEYKKTLAVDFLEKRMMVPTIGEEVTSKKTLGVCKNTFCCGYAIWLFWKN